MGLEAGSGSLRVSAEATDQLIAAINSAIAPDGSMALSPSPNEWLTSTTTPPIPTSSAKASRRVRRCVPRKKISDSAMNTGMVANMTAVTPDGTRVSAQKTSP